MPARRRWPAGCARSPKVPEPLAWGRDGAHWPHREASAFVEAGALRWHVQRLGARGAPVLLLLHGTGASTHSWRDLAPHLAADHDVIAPDLPGHAFSTLPPRTSMSLPGMAAALAALLAALGAAPQAVVGHSAGAALAVQAALDGLVAPRLIVGLNAALWPLPGGHWWSPAARLLALNPLVPHAFARAMAWPGAVERLLRGTGSTLDARGVALYRRLVSDPGHVGAALSMMSQWDLEALHDALPRLRVPLHLIVGSGDRAVPPAQARWVAARVPRCRIEALEGLGHLAHEEAPARVAEAIGRALAG